MANLAGDLSRTIFGQSDAVKAFRPWWIVMEDYVMYAMVLMGAITLPMTFLTGTPLECVIHPEIWHASQLAINCTSAKNLHSLVKSLNPALAETLAPEPKITVRRMALYLRSFAKKYCAENVVSPFVLYLPFCLFLTPILLILIERGFSTCFSTERRENVLYNSLLKSSLEREDVQELERETARKSFEVYQNLRKSQNLYKAYYWRGWATLGTILCLLMFYSAFEKDVGMSLISCHICQIPFICVLSNTKFFSVIFQLAYLLVVGYLVLAVYNVIWFHYSTLPKLGSILSGLRQMDRHSEKKKVDILEAMLKLFTKKNKKTLHVPEVRLELYYTEDAQDFRLMMNLFAEKSSASTAHALRILTLFDKHFQRLWKPTDFLVQKRSLSEMRGDQANKDDIGIDLMGSVDNFLSPPNFQASEKTSQSSRRVSKINTQEGGEEEADEESEVSVGDIKRLCVLFNDAPIADYMASKLPKVVFEYTVEIFPAHLVETPVKSVKYHRVPDLENSEQGGMLVPDCRETEALMCKSSVTSTVVVGSSAALETSGCNQTRGHDPISTKQKYALWFDGFVDMSSCKDGPPAVDGFQVTVSTELGGVTVAQVILRDTLKEDKCEPGRAMRRKSLKESKLPDIKDTTSLILKPGTLLTISEPDKKKQ